MGYNPMQDRTFNPKEALKLFQIMREYSQPTPNPKL